MLRTLIENFRKRDKNYKEIRPLKLVVSRDIFFAKMKG